MVEKAQKSHGERSELNSVFGLERVDRWNPIRTSAMQFRLLLIKSRTQGNLLSRTETK
jgi:hypothetical protein